MHNRECPMCKEIGWGLVESDGEELTITMHCTMCDHQMVVHCHNPRDWYKTLVATAVIEIHMAVEMLGKEIMDMTGWDDCQTFATIREETNKQIPEGC